MVVAALGQVFGPYGIAFVFLLQTKRTKQMKKAFKSLFSFPSAQDSSDNEDDDLPKKKKATPVEQNQASTNEPASPSVSFPPDSTSNNNNKNSSNLSLDATAVSVSPTSNDNNNTSNSSNNNSFKNQIYSYPNDQVTSFKITSGYNNKNFAALTSTLFAQVSDFILICGNNSSQLYYYNLLTGEALRIDNPLHGNILTMFCLPELDLLIHTGSDGVIFVRRVSQKCRIIRVMNGDGQPDYNNNSQKKQQLPIEAQTSFTVYASIPMIIGNSSLSASQLAALHEDKYWLAKLKGTSIADLLLHQTLHLCDSAGEAEAVVSKSSSSSSSQVHLSPNDCNFSSIYSFSSLHYTPLAVNSSAFHDQSSSSNDGSDDSSSASISMAIGNSLYLITGDVRGYIRFYNVNTGQRVYETVLSNTIIYALAYNPYLQILACGGSLNKVYFAHVCFNNSYDYERKMTPAITLHWLLANPNSQGYKWQPAKEIESTEQTSHFDDDADKTNGNDDDHRHRWHTSTTIMSLQWINKYELAIATANSGVLVRNFLQQDNSKSSNNQFATEINIQEFEHTINEQSSIFQALMAIPEPVNLLLNGGKSFSFIKDTFASGHNTSSCLLGKENHTNNGKRLQKHCNYEFNEEFGKANFFAYHRPTNLMACAHVDNYAVLYSLDGPQIKPLVHFKHDKMTHCVALYANPKRQHGKYIYAQLLRRQNVDVTIITNM